MSPVSAFATDTITVVVAPAPILAVTLAATVQVPIVLAANAGPPGPPGPWTKMTQAEYDALPVKDEHTLYVIIN